MDAMKSSTRTMWAGIEFQPDLQKPRRPVRLGVLSLTSSGDAVLLGRQPILDNKPPEFNEVSTVSLELAANWIDSMWKDILEAKKENAFNRLNERWRWNLYVRPIRMTNASEGDLLMLAKQAYERFVGEPFHIPVRRAQRRPHRPVHRQHRHAGVSAHALPQAWLISEIMKRSSALGLAADA
jgi:hypothetical protein